jgi:hypothetical protein
VTSDEPDNAPGSGDGNTIHDIVILGDTTVKLRAEHHTALNGRVYNIHFRVQDGAGNQQVGVCPVQVILDECKPKPDEPPKPECVDIDDGVANTVCH